MQGAGDKLQITECQGFLYKKWAGAGEWGGVDWRDGGGKAHTGERMDGPRLLGSTSYGPGIVTPARA